MSIEWIDRHTRVPDDRRNVLVWGTDGVPLRGPRFLGVSKFNIKRDSSGRFDIENSSSVLPFFVRVTHWAEINGPDTNGPP